MTSQPPEPAPDLVRRDTNMFGLPSGLRGRLAGRMMARNSDQQREILTAFAPQPGWTICEIGHGPGRFAELLTEQHTDVRLIGVDPSSTMRTQATRRCRTAVNTGRASFVHGAAARLPFTDSEFDAVVAINNIEMWPDVDAGLTEARRVLRPGGVLLVSWHAATSPSRISRRLARPDHELDVITERMARVFANAHRRTLTHSVLWTAEAPKVTVSASAKPGGHGPRQ